MGSFGVDAELASIGGTRQRGLFWNAGATLQAISRNYAFVSANAAQRCAQSLRRKPAAIIFLRGHSERIRSTRGHYESEPRRVAARRRSFWVTRVAAKEEPRRWLLRNCHLKLLCITEGPERKFFDERLTGRTSIRGFPRKWRTPWARATRSQRHWCITICGEHRWRL